MAEKMITIKCPACGASLSAKTGEKQIVCEYCDTKILLNNENEHIYKHVDEAELKKAETEQLLKIKQMEMKEKQMLEKQKKARVKVIASIVLGVISVLSYVFAFAIDAEKFGALSIIGVFTLMGILFIWVFSMSGKDKDEDEKDTSGKIEVPESAYDYEKKHYNVIKEIFVDAGFLNVKCVPLNDLTIALFKKPNLVDSITINGDDIESADDEYKPNAKIVIYYHSFEEQ